MAKLEKLEKVLDVVIQGVFPYRAIDEYFTTMQFKPISVSTNNYGTIEITFERLDDHDETYMDDNVLRLSPEEYDAIFGHLGNIGNILNHQFTIDYEHTYEFDETGEGEPITIVNHLEWYE